MSRRQRPRAVGDLPGPPQRQRADGTWTYTTEEWDARWYWPVGTRVRVGVFGDGVVTKQNSVTVRVRFDAGLHAGTLATVKMQHLTRLGVDN